MAFALQRGRKRTVAVDGESHAAYDGAYCPRFSPDGKRLAFRAQLGPELGGRNFIVCDGRALRSYDWVCWRHHVFSPDSRHLAYIAWRGTKGPAPAEWHGTKWFVVCDGREGPPVDWKNRYAWPQVPVFSPDSRHLAYFATRGDKQFIVIDGVEGPRHVFVRIPDKPCEVEGKLRYAVGDGKQAWLLEVDWPKDLDWTNGLDQPTQ